MPHNFLTLRVQLPLQSVLFGLYANNA